MCGFTAYVGPNAQAHTELVSRMAERLRYRGPDDSGQYASRGVVLAHRRLSIIDVGGGTQPLLNEDGRVALVCNGEIYNHRELRAGLEGRHRFRTRSDSEVILHLYEEKGPLCVQDLDGMFAFVVTDGERFLAAPTYRGLIPSGSSSSCATATGLSSWAPSASRTPTPLPCGAREPSG
jgi:asparagine synthase (glutamine-hydrolysing)